MTYMPSALILFVFAFLILFFFFFFFYGNTEQIQLKSHLSISNSLDQWWATFSLLRAKKELWFLSQATPTTLAKVHIILIHIIIFFPLGAWRAAQELLAGCMQPAGRKLPTPGLDLNWALKKVNWYDQFYIMSSVRSSIWPCRLTKPIRTNLLPKQSSSPSQQLGSSFFKIVTWLPRGQGRSTCIAMLYKRVVYGQILWTIGNIPRVDT